MRLITQYFLTLCWAKVILFFFQAKKGILHLSVLQRALNCNSTAYTSPNSFQQKISKLPDYKHKAKNSLHSLTLRVNETDFPEKLLVYRSSTCENTELYLS